MSYKYITRYTSPNSTPGNSSRAVFGMARKIEGITIHHWGDPKNKPKFMNVVNFLCRRNGNTSAHYVATGTGRQVACIVNPGDVAWHSGNAWGNARTIGVELDPRARDVDYDVAAELIADIRSAYGDVPIYWHSYFIQTACPGRWDAYRLDKLSYTKYSHKTAWGKGGDKKSRVKPEPPKPKPVPPKHDKPSPTTNGSDGEVLVDTGKPVTEKIDYSKENNTLLKQVLQVVQQILSKLTSVFK